MRGGSTCIIGGQFRFFVFGSLQEARVSPRLHKSPTGAGNLALACAFWKLQPRHEPCYRQLILSGTRCG